MKDKVYTTLAQIRADSLCQDGWKKLCTNLGGLKAYGEDTPLSFKQIYDSNGYDDTLWCLRATDKKFHPLWRHFAVDCAEQVKHLMTDKRSLNALEVARRHADGKATDEELAAARAAARAAALDAAWAAGAAAWAAGAAARAARAAAWDAAWAAGAAARAAWDAAGDAAGDAARAAQIELLFEYCRTGKRVKAKKRKVA